MVICPVRVTYNHVSIFVCSRAKKPRVSSLKLFRSQHRLTHGSLVVITSNASPISCGSPLILWFFFGNIYVRLEWHITTYRYFFAQERKKALILPGREAFSFGKFLYLFKISHFSRKFQFLLRICRVVSSTISGTCHHEVNLARVNLFNNTSFKTSTQTR